MHSEDLETAGAVYQLIMDEAYYTRIQPPLVADDYVAFLKRYYSRCVLEDPNGEWVDSRYEAAWGNARWISHLWHDPGVARPVLSDLKEWLLNLYREGDEHVRTSLITGTLEHLFEESELAVFFSDWRSNPLTGSAYQEALSYAQQLRKDKGPS
jgi:hypothetical protein